MVEKKEFRIVDIELIYPDKSQPRKTFEYESIKGLAETIKNLGLINPLEILEDGKGKYLLIAGERRWRACKLIGLKQVPATILKKLSERDKLERQLVEDIADEAIQTKERDLGWKKLYDLYQFIKKSQLASKLGVSHEQVTRSFDRLELNLSDDLYEKLTPNAISETMGLDNAIRISLLKKFIREKWDRERLRDEVKKIRDRQSLRKDKFILLINPPVEDVQYWDKYNMPYQLLRIGTWLKKKGYDVALLDAVAHSKDEHVKKQVIGDVVTGSIRQVLYHYGKTQEEIEEELRSYPEPKEVWITSGMTYWYKDVNETIKTVRKVFPKTKIKVGGIAASILPKETFKGADEIVCGPLPRNVSFEWSDLSLLENKLDYAIISTSQGCNFCCEYCSAKKIYQGKGWIGRDIKDVVDEIEDKIKNWGIKHFVFYEDNLLINCKDHFEKILDLIIKRELKITLMAPEGINPGMVYAGLPSKMRQAGFRTITLALENVDEDLEKSWKRAPVSKKIDEIVKMFKDEGWPHFSLRFFVLYGLPGQSVESVIRTVLKVMELGGRCVPMLYTPIPATEQYEKMDEEMKKKDYWELNGKLFPFAKEVYSKGELTAFEYESLLAWMYSIESISSNFDMHGEWPHYLDNSAVMKGFRKVLAEKESDYQ